VCGAQHAAEPVQQRLQAGAASLQPGRALVAALGGGRAGLLVDALEQRLAAVAADEQLQRLVEPLAVQVRVQVVQARAKDGAFAPVGGSANPTNLLTYTAPVFTDTATVDFKQTIPTGEPLRTGTYAKTLTFTLSTTQP